MTKFCDKAFTILAVTLVLLTEILCLEVFFSYPKEPVGVRTNISHAPEQLDDGGHVSSLGQQGVNAEKEGQALLNSRLSF